MDDDTRLDCSDYPEEAQKHLLAQIKENFKTFGAGQQFPGANMTALALEDGPLCFAAGVDVADVVELVLRESGIDALVGALQQIIRTFKSPKKYNNNGDAVNMFYIAEGALKDLSTSRQ